MSVTKRPGATPDDDGAPVIAFADAAAFEAWLEKNVSHEPGAWLHSRKALDRVVTGWRELVPLNAWLTTHVGPSTEPPPTRGR